ncbi:MAG: hypothetical protein KQH53_11620 [Desulfarculaceae bacterium]|nr:hypothetical protein [Desulfarculaceae bacterium]
MAIDSAKRIVVFRPGTFGDTLTALPLLFYVCHKYPNCSIEYISEKHQNDNIITPEIVFSLVDLNINVHYFEAHDPPKLIYNKLKQSLKPRVGDLFLYASYQKKSIKSILRDYVFFKLLGYYRCAGFIGHLVQLYNDKKCTIYSKEYDRLFSVFRFINVSADKSNCVKFIIDSDGANDFWGRNGLRDRFVIAVCLGSKMQSKRWSVNNYFEVFRRIKDKFPNVIYLVVGGRDEKKAAEKLRDYLGNNNVFEVTGSSLDFVSSTMSKCSLYIGNDTGPMHLASLHGVPCITLFASRDLKGRWFPYGEKNINLFPSVPCAGCMLDTCYVNPSLCLAQIDIDDVVESAKKMISDLMGGEK